MPEPPDDLDQMFELAPRLLAATKSLVQSLGPFRQFHPEWPAVANAARVSLSECDAARARRMERALARLEDHETNYNQLRFDCDQLERGRITTEAQHDLPLLNELKQRNLVELQDAEAPSTPALKIRDLEQAKKVAGDLATTAAEKYRRSKRLAVRCERMARPALQDAEIAAASSWVNKQLAQLRDLHAKTDALVTGNHQLLPGLVDLEGQAYCGRKFSSACAALCEVATNLIAHVAADGPDGRMDWLEAVDYEDLGVKLECELAALRRQAANGPDRPTASIDFALQRVLIDAKGEHLGFAQIFERAKHRPTTSELFPMTKHNRDHEKRICALIGRQTKDGWTILGNEGGRGRRREFWAEKSDARDA